MYLAILRNKLDEFRKGVWRATVVRSGMLTVMFLLALLVVLVLVVRQRGTGHLTKIKAELHPKAEAPPVTTAQPGGQDPVVLQRFPTAGGSVPEFLSATLLPGRGMNVLQITASLPDKGDVQLLASPSLDDAAKAMSGIGQDANGAASLQMGAAIELPWAGRMGGVAASGPTRTMANWHGKSLGLPVYSGIPGEQDGAVGGMLLRLGADSVKTNVMPDGGDVMSTFTAGDFGGHWPSHTDVSTTILLSSRHMEITVTARNAGTEPQPFGIGWYPRFMFPGGDRKRVLLHLPNAEREETRADGSGLPTGRLLEVAGTAYDFTAHGGMPLGSMTLNENFVHLKAGLLDNGPFAELRDPGNDFGLRITALSPTIKAMRVTAPAGQPYISIQPQFNVDDPLGHEWAADSDTGMVVLQPGESVQWKVRLEIFSLSAQISGRL